MRSRTILATPPGYTIREQLEDRHMTQKEFALRMDMSEKHISHLINGEVSLTPEVAIRIETILGISARYWNNLEARYREKLLLADEENAMDADIEILRQMPYAEAVRYGWIENASKIFDKVRNMRRFFEVARLGAISKLRIPGIAYRKLGDTAKNDYVLAVWAQRARLVAREREVAPINFQRLAAIIDDVRELTTETLEEFIPKLYDYYGGCGVAIVFLQHMKGSFLHGASFTDGKKIVMALTLRGTDADKFWFSLFHETAHILEGHITKPEGTTAEDEAQADKFARDTLILPEDYERFVQSGGYTASAVKDFADEVGIDAGIVVGRLQKDGKVDFNRLNGLKKHYKFA
ncbi:MAG: helix-turn-helix domain-containing protein [Synergistaceae bacterium]|nr:helix-turn-helix domain-containing protein [Synergistaceae bacterium]